MNDREKKYKFLNDLADLLADHNCSIECNVLKIYKENVGTVCSLNPSNCGTNGDWIRDQAEKYAPIKNVCNICGEEMELVEIELTIESPTKINNEAKNFLKYDAKSDSWFKKIKYWKCKCTESEE